MSSPTMQNPPHLAFIQAQDPRDNVDEENIRSPRVVTRTNPSIMSLIEYVLSPGDQTTH